MMKDTRVFEKKAKELISLRKRLVFRKLISDVRLIERILEPTMFCASDDYILYKNTSILYTPKGVYKITNINDVDYTKLNMRRKETLNSMTTKDGIVTVLVSELLKDEYHYYEN